jgi:hypothetical protein
VKHREEFVPSRRGLLPVAALAALLLTACGVIPEWRVWQKKVPTDAGKPPAQAEAERRGAKLIVIDTAVVAPDPVKQIAAVHEVAAALSASLGEPAALVVAEDHAAILDALRRGILAQQKRADDWRAFALKYSGKEIEGTGFDIAKPSVLLAIAAVLALLVFVPGAFTAAIFVIKRLQGTIRTMAQAVEETDVKDPAVGAAIKKRVGEIGDKSHSKIIERELKHVDWQAVRRAGKRVDTPTTG